MGRRENLASFGNVPASLSIMEADSTEAVSGFLIVPKNDEWWLWLG